MTARLRVATLGEVATVLAAHGTLPCVPDVEIGRDGAIVLTVRTYAPACTDAHDSLGAVNLLHDLEYLVGLAQVRAFAAKYAMDATALEALLPDRRKET